jgi:hypothetical protein
MPSKVWRELRLGPAILALPWLYALILWWQGLRNPQRPPLEP